VVGPTAHEKKVVDFLNSRSDATVLFFVSLTLNVDLVSRTCEESWQRSDCVEKDWLFVEMLEDDDELGAGKAGGPVEVGLAATAARNRRR